VELQIGERSRAQMLNYKLALSLNWTQGLASNFVEIQGLDCKVSGILLITRIIFQLENACNGFTSTRDLAYGARSQSTVNRGSTAV
jgi:hypothetical protein